MSIAIKSGPDGARVLGLRTEALLAMLVADEVFSELGHVDDHTGAHCVLTSGVEGEHSRRSRHYVGLATDFRIRHLPDRLRIKAAEELRERLGDEYFVKLEPTHIHVKFNGSER